MSEFKGRIVFPKSDARQEAMEAMEKALRRARGYVFMSRALQRDEDLAAVDAALSLAAKAREGGK